MSNKLIYLAGFAYVASMATGLLYRLDKYALTHNVTIGTGTQTIGAIALTQAPQMQFSLILLTELFVVIIATSIVLLYLAKTRNWLRRFYQAYMYFSIMYSTLYLGVIWFSLVSATLALAVGIIYCAITLYLYVTKRYAYFNLFGMTIAIASAVIIGANINPYIALGLLVLVAVYDWWAVMKSGTMLQLVDVIMQDNKPLPFMLIDGSPQEFAQRVADRTIKCKTCHMKSQEVKRIDDKKEYLCRNCGRHTIYEKSAKSGIVKLSQVMDEGDRTAKKAPLPKGSGLGLGDIVIPGIVLVSIYTSFASVKFALFAFCGAIIGLYLNFLWLKYRKQAIPAIPLIAASMLVMLAIGIVL